MREKGKKEGEVKEKTLFLRLLLSIEKQKKSVCFIKLSLVWKKGVVNLSLCEKKICKKTLVKQKLIVMLDDNNLFQRAASSAYASMAAFTAAANMYNSFYPTTTNTNADPVNYFGCPGKNILLSYSIDFLNLFTRRDEKRNS